MYYTIVGRIADENDRARFDEALNRPLPGRADVTTKAQVEDEMALFRSAFGAAGGS